MSENWVDGDFESGADGDGQAEVLSQQDTGVALGEGEASTLEPEEDEAAPDPS